MSVYFATCPCCGATSERFLVWAVFEKSVISAYVSCMECKNSKTFHYTDGWVSTGRIAENWNTYVKKVSGCSEEQGA